MIRKFLPANRARSTWPAGPKITLHFPRLLVYIYTSNKKH